MNASSAVRGAGIGLVTVFQGWSTRGGFIYDRDIEDTEKGHLVGKTLENFSGLPVSHLANAADTAK